MQPGELSSINGQIVSDRGVWTTGYSLGTAPYPGSFAQDSLLNEYLRTLIKRKWVILASVATIVSIVTICTLRTPPIFVAVGSIAINKIDPMVFSLKESSPGEFEYYDPADLDTEVRILRSDLLALQVIRQLNLDKSTDTVAPTNNDLTTDAYQSDPSRTSAALASFRGNLQVSLVPNTRIIELRYRSTDKELAARVVNALASTYVEQNFKTRFESTMQASDWLSKQLVDLQIKVETSQEKLVQYQKEHQILGIDEKQNIITAKLDELNRELTAAEAARMEKEALYRSVEGADSPLPPDAASSGNKIAPVDSALLEKLREQKAELEVQIAQMNTQFGPAYPKLVQMNGQLKELTTQIQTENSKVVGRLRADYLAAAQQEKMLQDALEQQKVEANKLNESSIEYSLLKRDVDTNRTLYEGLLEKLKEAGVTAGLRSNNFRIVDVARVPTAPSEPNLPRNLGFALALGLTTGIGLSFLLEGLDNTVRTPDQAQAVSALPSLGVIPLGSRRRAEMPERKRLTLAASKEAVELVALERPKSQMAESYRALRTSLLLTSLGGPPHVILVTSALPGEGKSTTTLNAAIVLAQKGARVLLIDADLRRPTLHKTLGMGPRQGLSDLLTGNSSLTQAIVPTHILPNLFLLPAGTPPPNPAELLASTDMQELLVQLRSQYDHIVMDTPPTLSVTDAVILSTLADRVVLVIRSGQTTKQALRRARDILMQVNAHVCGVLLNAVDLASPDYYDYCEYRDRYSSYYREDHVSEANVNAAAVGD
jgi:polysaccharide biosynthesis transport protein